MQDPCPYSERSQVGPSRVPPPAGSRGRGAGRGPAGTRARSRAKIGAMTHNLILLRHGESEWNQKNLFTGWVDVT
ncbi:histidine phosphatase family protein, partial [Mycobacterium tuberculosis]|uniref:histidine phosphatase family protein n=1 Tax=Mycobacterium tuberculosis TaxID=1773 RepID=UPI0034D35E24